MTTLPKKPWHTTVKFLTSANSLDNLPEDIGHEIVFLGRSNVGKSSILNVLSNKKNLAKTSKQPGRTRLINVFDCNQGRLVDLPGYGYAKVPLKMRQHWDYLISNYLERRISLSAMILIIDIRHSSNVLDTKMLNWCQQAKLPLQILLNKTDKLPHSKADNTLKQFNQAHGSKAILFSTKRHQGVTTVREQIASWFAEPASFSDIS